METTEKLVRKLGFNRVKLNEPMSSHTWIKVGGPADLYFEAENEDDLTEAVGCAVEFGIPYTEIGLGANVLVSDKGIRGLVIVNKSNKIKFLPHNFVEVASGCNIITLTREAANRGLGGLERLTKVPATVGGAIYMNAGDTGKSEFFGDLIVSIKVINKEGEPKKLFSEDANFTYR